MDRTGSGEGPGVAGGVLGASDRVGGKGGNEQMGILLMRWTARMEKVRINQGRERKRPLFGWRRAELGRCGGWEEG